MLCARLTLREQMAGRIPVGSRFRLPTEAEWEYASRSWNSTRFSYGDDLGYDNLTQYAWYRDNSDSTTHPVGEKLPNSWGLYDMSGRRALPSQNAVARIERRITALLQLPLGFFRRKSR